MNDELKFASATAVGRNIGMVATELAAQIHAGLVTARVDLLVIFMAAHFTRFAEQLATELREELQPRAMLTCSTQGVIGSDQEIETADSVSVLAAHLPGVTLTPFALSPRDWDELTENESAFREAVDAPPDTKVILLFADPFSTPSEEVLTAFNTYYPNVPVIGGMASGGNAAGTNVLMLNRTIVQRGAVGVALGGNLEADILVSQGCRPIGEPLHVTKSSKNVMYELDGEPALTRLREMVDTLSDADRDLIQNGLMLGRAVGGTTEALGRGDFLVRGVMGIDPQSGAVAIGDYIGDGETVQFHVQDQETATEDLELLLMPQMFADAPKGALLFSCNGRGTRLYDHPNGDIQTIQKALGGVALAGFFCAGEIGPIRGKNFLHGQTASMVIFR